jgi:hypothetical protein
VSNVTMRTVIYIKEVQIFRCEIYKSDWPYSTNGKNKTYCLFVMSRRYGLKLMKTTVRYIISDTGRT